MKKPEGLRLRGHHLFCMNVGQFDRYSIYNQAFTTNADRARRLMATQPQTLIEIVAGGCDTCRYCPSFVTQDNRCQIYDYVEGADEIDRRMLDQLGLTVGQVITAGELRARIASHFAELPSMCFYECPFQDVLKCAEGLALLRGTTLSEGCL